MPLARSTHGFAVERHERLLRPPGALDEEHFLVRCIRCGECMKVCPNNALHPTLTEAGLEGLWTPVLVPAHRLLRNQLRAVLAGVSHGSDLGDHAERKRLDRGTWRGYQTDPAGHWPFTIVGAACPGRWLPSASSAKSGAQPLPRPSIFGPAEVVDAAGNVKQVKQPYLDPARCVGCGACEYACPVQDRPAVYVTSIGESRSRTNQILLNRGKRRPN